VNEMDLLGRVAAATLVKDHFVAPESAGSQARIVLYLTHEEVGAVGRAVLAHPVLAPQVALRVPREMGERAGLPEIALTDEKAVWWRNHAVEGRSVMLLGVADDT